MPTLLEGARMNVEELIKRLNKFLVGRSLRRVADECGVSHELIRKLAQSKKGANVTLTKYNQIDEGLRKNGF